MPTLTTALRGMANVTVEVRTLESGKHSGQYGGAAPDALLALLRALASLHDERRRRRGRRPAARGVGGRAAAGGGLPRAGHGPRRHAADRHRRPRVARLVGPRDHGHRHRRAVGRRRRQRRLAVRARRAQRARAPRAGRGRGAGRGHPPPARAAAVRHRARRGSPARPATASRRPPAGPAYAAARAAWSAAWGREVLLAGSGGSIPIVSALAYALPDAEALLVGATDGFANIHGPDERLLLSEFENAVVAEADFLGRYAEAFAAMSDDGARRRDRRLRRARGRLHPARAGLGREGGQQGPQPGDPLPRAVPRRDRPLPAPRLAGRQRHQRGRRQRDPAVGDEPGRRQLAAVRRRARGLHDRDGDVRGQGPADRRRHPLHVHVVRAQLPRLHGGGRDPRGHDRRRRRRVLGARRRADPQARRDLVAGAR